MQGRSSSQTVVFFPEGAFGPTNNCVGIADVLQRRGHRVVFVVEESFAGTLEAKGFEERLMRLKPKPDQLEEPGQFWKDFIRDTAPQFRRPTIEQLEGLIAPIWTELIDGSKYVQPRLEAIFDEVRPDVIVQDNVVAFPAVLTAGVPWVRIMSCNPLEMRDPELPPTFSGYPTGDRTAWSEFAEEYERTHANLWGDFDAFVAENGADPLPRLEFMPESPFLNLYVYPAEADYERSRPLAGSWSRLESCVRDTEGDFELPNVFRSRRGALIYLSLGSLGSADTNLMSRLIQVLAETPHRYVVSKGPQHELIELADNMWGEEYLPQPSILPMADVVITHGGNNTVTECLHFGRPMVVLPLFWDQYDNAQRIDEVGLGVRLASYSFEAEDLVAAIARLLADGDVRSRLQRVAARLQSSPGTVRAADLIERVAAERRPIGATGRST
jgi:MGT family glycosyltransferase